MHRNATLHPCALLCSISVGDPEIIQVGFESVLGGEAGIREVAPFSVPLLKPPVIEEFQVILDDKGNDIVFQAFFEQNQATYSAVAVLEGVDPLKSHMEVYEILNSHFFLAVVT